MTLRTRVTPLQLFVVWLLCSAMPSVGGAADGRRNADGRTKLEQFFKEVTSLKTQFVQQVRGQDHVKLETSSGSLLMQRPGKFLWDYSAPYEQRIIADGRQLWIYDVELDQVVVKPLEQALGNTPAVLLSGGSDLGDKFEISNYQPLPTETNGLSWVELVPKDQEAGFQQLRLGFATELQEMVLVDAFGQVTQIVFSELQRNVKIKASVFDFVPPPGVDILGDK